MGDPRPPPPTPPNVVPLSKNMEYILQQAALAKGLDPTVQRANGFSHLILKYAPRDAHDYLSVVVRRLTLCCPVHPPPASSDPPTTQHDPHLGL